MARWVLGVVLVISGTVALASFPLRHLIAGRFQVPVGTIGLFLASIPAFALAYTSGELVRADKRVARGALLQHVFPYGLTSLAILVLWAQQDLRVETVGRAWLLAVMASAVIGVLLVERVGLTRESPGPSPAVRRELRRVAPAIAWTSLVVISINQVDVLVLGLFAEAESVSRYVAASRLALFAGLSLVGVNAIMAPLFVDHAVVRTKEDADRMELLARRGARWAAALGGTVAMVLVLAAPWVLSLFDPSFADAAPLLVILLAGQIVNVSTGGVILLLQMTGNERVSARVMTAVAVLLLPAYVIGAKSLGATGVALVTCAGVGGGNLALVASCRRAVGVSTLSDRVTIGVGLFLGSAAVGWGLWHFAPGMAPWVWPGPALMAAVAAWFALFDSEDRAWFLARVPWRRRSSARMPTR